MSAYSVDAASPFKKQLAAKLDWWRENREKNPLALDDELESFMDFVGDNPWASPKLSGNPATVRSFLLRKTQHRIAYSVDDETKSVLLLTIWNTRETPPVL